MLKFQQSDAATGARNAFPARIPGRDSVLEHQYHVQLLHSAQLSADGVRLLDAILAHSYWSAGAHLSTHHGVLVGAQGATTDRLLEHVGGLFLPHSPGGHLLHHVAQCQAVSFLDEYNIIP